MLKQNVCTTRLVALTVGPWSLTAARMHPSDLLSISLRLRVSLPNCQGLLAGQWECPCIILRDGSEETTKTAAGVGASKDTKGAAPTGQGPKVSESERVKKADHLLFSDLGLCKILVRGEMMYRCLRN